MCPETTENLGSRRAFLQGAGLGMLAASGLTSFQPFMARSWAAGERTRFVSTWNAPDIMDPHVKYDVGAAAFNLNIYDNLLRYQGSPPAVVPWLAQHEAGSGAYRLVKFDQATGFLMERFSEFWRGWRDKHVEEVEIKVMREQSSRTLALMKGDVHIIETLLGADQLEKLEKHPRIKVTPYESMRFFLIRMHNQREPFTDINVRKAFSYAFNYESFIKDLMKGRVVRNPVPIPRPLWGYPTDVPGYEYDLGKAVVGACLLIGVPAGLIAGYYENVVSHLIMRTADVFLAVPRVILALAMAQALGPSLPNLILALTVTYWPWFTLVVVAETKAVKKATFIEATEALGVGPWRTIFGHVLPNMLSPLIVRSTLSMGLTIITAAVLGFLGMGAQPPIPEWGAMIAEARLYLPDAWWYATAPGLAIFFVVMGFNLLGDALRDILDPRLRRGRN